MANTPDRRTRQAQALRDNLKRRKEQERQRSRDPDEEAPPAETPAEATVDKAGKQEGELP
jgi:hypothetical protein